MMSREAANESLAWSGGSIHNISLLGRNLSHRLLLSVSLYAAQRSTLAQKPNLLPRGFGDFWKRLNKTTGLLDYWTERSGVE